MKTRVLLAILVACGMGGAAAAQDSQPKDPTKQIQKETKKATDAVKKAAEQAGQPSEAEMKAWMEASSPGPNHKRLDPFVGEWNVKSVTQMGPDAPKEETTGHSSAKWVLDGRFLLQEYSGTMMGMPFKGLGTWGYDNIKKQYVGTWMDSSSTGIMNNAGTYDEATRTWTMKGSFQEPSGQVIPCREVIRMTDPNTHTFEFFMTGPDGKEFKSMTLTYTRAKGGDTRPTTDPARK